MNSLDDILSRKADEIFEDSAPDDDKSPEINPEINLDQLKTLAYGIKDQLEAVIRLLNKEKIGAVKIESPANQLETGEKIIEGVFNGQKMIGPDGKEYEVAPNYASKSKLVEGDLLKLTISNNGSFIYKQIGPIERKRLVGELFADPETNQWLVRVDGKTYKVLTASVTFYKGKTGDEAVVLVPKDGAGDWAALDNIIK